ncbi:MAG: proline dehydrogenase family protein [Acidobacteriia bacterium]|nr:proline dehydrogenase family protein [Terriglobia bacterium]
MKAKVRKFVSRLSTPVLRRAASSYVAGPEIDDALRVALRIQRMGFTATIGFWNGDHDSPRLVADAYLQSLAAMPGRNLDNLCIKLPALQYSYELLEEVLCVAKRLNVRVHFDSLGLETVDRTLSVLDRALLTYTNLGITFPASWKRSLKDIDWAIERKLPIRIVKGQWPDSSSVNSDQDFASAIRRLAGRVARVNVATHNAELARQSLECLHAAGTRGNMDLLYGLPVRRSLVVAKHFAAPVRFYIPFGHAWLPYCFSQARKNPRILLWMLKDSLFSNGIASMGAKEMLSSPK